MKKAIIITVILIAALSCAFSSSDETHVLKLKSQVGVVDPAFQFEFTSGMLSETTVELITNSDAEAFGNTTYDYFGTNDTATEVADISRYNLTLLFTAKLANRAKSNDSFTMKFSAGGFDVTRNGVEGKLNPSSELLVVSDGLSTLVGLSAGEVDRADNSVRFSFNGTECQAGDLATFQVGYTADKTIDPMRDGYYYTDISLEISSDF